MDRLSRLDGELEAAGGADRDHEAKAILSGLGFKDSDFSRDMREFSGGWIMRARTGSPAVPQSGCPAAGRAERTTWTSRPTCGSRNTSRHFPGGVIITSHDRAFLNTVANRILAIEPGEVVHHHGNYDGYLVARERALELKQAAAAARNARSSGRCGSSSGSDTRPPRRGRCRAG